MYKLFFITGTMGSGKSTQLIAKDYNYRENGKKTLILKPTTDTTVGTLKTVKSFRLKVLISNPPTTGKPL